MDGRFAGFRDDGQFDTFVGEKLECPLASPFGRSGTGDANQMGFGTTIEDRLNGRGGSFFALESGGKSFFDEAFADVGDGIGVAMELLGDIVVGNCSVFALIDSEQNIGVFDLLGTALTRGNKLDEFGAFDARQGYDVNLLHGGCHCS